MLKLLILLFGLLIGISGYYTYQLFLEVPKAYQNNYIALIISVITCVGLAYFGLGHIFKDELE